MERVLQVIDSPKSEVRARFCQAHIRKSACNQPATSPIG